MRTHAILDNAKLYAEVAQEIAVAGLGLRGLDAARAMNNARRRTVERMERERWQAIQKGAWITRVNTHGGERHDTVELQTDATDHAAAPGDHQRCAVGDSQGTE